MQKRVDLVDLVDLVKSFPTNIFLQNLASIQKRTSPIKFAHLAEKSEKGSISNLSTKAISGHEAVVAVLRAAGADENVPTPDGFTRPALLAAGAGKNAADQSSAVKTADGTSLVSRSSYR